jgi:dipeptidyl aminopeptidase/acylaminoacyl peptidase
MTLNRRHFVGAAVVATMGATAGCLMPRPQQTAAPAPTPAPAQLPAAPRQAAMPPLLQEALASLDKHSRRVARRDRIALADFSLHSSEQRFHLVDVAGGRIEQSWLVAHGKGSDPGHTGQLQRFSNQYGSNATSRGAYCTANPYYGKYGRSQRLIGLDPDNDAALERAIVLHGADYVNPGLIASHGRIGRSYGCFSVELDQIGVVMDRLGEGTLIYAGQIA